MFIPIFNGNNDLTSKPKINSFIDWYTKGDIWHKQDPGSGNLGYGWVHYSLIRLTKPDNVLCIGSKYGFIPAVCALACRDNKKGMVDFVDAGFDMEDWDKKADIHWGGVGFWKKCDSNKYFGKFGLQDYISLIVMKSSQYKALNMNKKYGYVHIDGDHSYKGVKTDFEMFWPGLDRGGFLALHDIGSSDKFGLKYGTRKFWKEITKKYQVALQFVEDPGLGIIQKI